MRKKIYLFVLVLLILLIAGFVFYIVRGQKSSITQGELSERSKDYLKNQSTSDDQSELKYVQLTGIPEGSKGKTITVGDCFTIQIPFIVDNQREKKDECHLYISTTRPDGSITAYQRSASDIADFDSVPGVSLRRVEKEKYKEEILKAGNKSFLGFINSKELEHTYFYYTPNSYFVITFDMHGIEIEKEIQETLKSINFLN